MQDHFIEVHGKITDHVCAVNTSHIVLFSDGEIVLSNEPMSKAEKTFHVTESYSDIKSMIRKAGARVDKMDPRLDTTIPLNMDELCKPLMIGEPVYNTSSHAWMLIVDSALDNNSWVDLCDHAGKVHRFGPHDVAKIQLYRMRRME